MVWNSRSRLNSSDEMVVPGDSQSEISDVNPTGSIVPFREAFFCNGANHVEEGSREDAVWLFFNELAPRGAAASRRLCVFSGSRCGMKAWFPLTSLQLCGLGRWSRCFTWILFELPLRQEAVPDSVYRAEMGRICGIILEPLTELQNLIVDSPCKRRAIVFPYGAH